MQEDAVARNFMDPQINQHLHVFSYSSFTFFIIVVLKCKFTTSNNRMAQLKNFNFTLLFFFTLISLSASAQSIRGNVRSLAGTSDLGYANVDIYQEDKLIASVLADKEGNFSVKLDTGSYRAEIIFAGYKKITEYITVRSDEKADFILETDAESKFNPEKIALRKAKDVRDDSFDDKLYAPHSAKREDIGETVLMVSDYEAVSSRAMKKSVGGRTWPMTPQQGVAGKLTAGEINDFSKWKLWTDLAKGEFDQYSTAWNYTVNQRYLLQLTDNNGLPIANAKIKLLNSEGKSHFAARTDNTGRAELWQSIVLAPQTIRTKYTIAGEYGGQRFTLKRPKTIAEGINAYVLDVTCEQSEKVDIAFVVDATGSMSDELSYLTAELNDVIFKSKTLSTSLNFRFANVFYRDHGDEYLTRTQDFTRVLSESVAFISEQRAGGGGDFPEAVDVALDTAINTLQWSENARARILFLILDAPPHNTPAIQEKLRLVSLQAAEKGIRIVPLVASGIDKSTEYLMRSIALATNGTYAFLTDDSGIGNTHLKPSTDSYEIETLNNLLVRIIKSYTYMADCLQKLPDLMLEYGQDTMYYTPADTTTTDSSIYAQNSKPVETIVWSYYPNPTTGLLNIKASAAIAVLHITDLSGKVLQIVKNIHPQQEVQVNLSAYASGIYLIRYPIGKRWISGKVVIQRS